MHSGRQGGVYEVYPDTVRPDTVRFSYAAGRGKAKFVTCCVFCSSRASIIRHSRKLALRLRQFARWRKSARVSRRKPRKSHFIFAFPPGGCFSKNQPLLVISFNSLLSVDLLICFLIQIHVCSHKVWASRQNDNKKEQDIRCILQWIILLLNIF